MAMATCAAPPVCVGRSARTVLRCTAAVGSCAPAASARRDKAAVPVSHSPSLSSSSLGAEAADNKRRHAAHELLDTEYNYQQDLQMVLCEFRAPLLASGTLSRGDSAVVFGNWEQLCAASQSTLDALQAGGRHRIGSSLLGGCIESLRSAYLCYARRHAPALDRVAVLQRDSPAFASHLQQCCTQSQTARGLQLEYFLLLPMNRVTKYPLIIEQIIKYTDEANSDMKSLRRVHESLKLLVSDVNEAVACVQNEQLLHWCELHVRRAAIRPSLTFASMTHIVGLRRLLHSGLLYKAKSSRLLVGLLFNDMLMLCEPDAAADVGHAESFKVTATTRLTLTLYKMPIMLSYVKLVPAPQHTGVSEDDELRLVAFYTGYETIVLRAASNNARTMWLKQLQPAVANAASAALCRLGAAGGGGGKSDARPEHSTGRLLVELAAIRHMDRQALEANFGGHTAIHSDQLVPAALVATMTVGRQFCRKSVDADSRQACCTQFWLGADDELLRVQLYAQRVYAPDVLLASANVALHELLHSGTCHKGPIVQTVSLDSTCCERADCAAVASAACIVLKFVVQLLHAD